MDESTHRTYEAAGKRVYYLSLEFLIGRLLRDALSNMGLTREMEKALRSYGFDLAAIEDLEPDAALGNEGSGGWQRASWRASPALIFLPTAMASAM